MGKNDETGPFCKKSLEKKNNMYCETKKTTTQHKDISSKTGHK